MDQGIVASTPGHYVRLALIFFASVLGLMLLGFAFGSSSASADDSGPEDGGLVPAVADLAGGVVETVAPVTTPVAAAIPLAGVPLSPAATSLASATAAAPIVGHALGSLPAGPVVGTLAKTLDATLGTAVGGLSGIVGSVLQSLSGLTSATDTALAAAASGVSAAGAAFSGAHGLWLGTTGPFGTGATGASGPSLTNFALAAATLGTGFLVLLFSRRLGLVNSTLPVSPVYETDTSPD